MKRATLLLTTMLALSGCAKENKPATASAPPPVTSDCSRGACDPGPGGTLPTPPPGGGGGGGGGGTYSGATATLTASAGALAQMFFNSHPNNPQQVRINVDMSRKSDIVVISFVDGGRVIAAGMGVVHPYSGVTNQSLNGWVSHNSTPVYKGFFQDQYGAVVLVIDKTVNTGDGTPAAFVGGSVFFQNFDNGYPNNPLQGPNLMCWQITYGPYDCRTFIVPGGVGGTVNMTSSLYPNNKGETRTVNYQKLGDFIGLSRAAAGL